MNVLPWLVIHGAAVWQVSLAVFLLGGLAAAWIRPRLAARRAAHRARALLGWPVSVSDTRRGARVTLAGTLEAAEAERLVLRAGDAKVRLDGPLEILAGSREVWPGRLPGAAEAQVLRSLSPGDRVRVTGILTQEASDEAPSYRDAAKRWTLGGGLAAAFDGPPRVSGPAPLVHVPPVIVAAVLFLGVFGGGGEVAMALATRELRSYSLSAEGGPGRAVLVASATPFRRHEALGALVRALDARSDPDPTALAARAALHELRGEQAEVAEMWIAHGEPERGARVAEGIAGFALAARGWYAAGEFQQAADAWERAGVEGDEPELRFGLGVNLLAQRLDRAARVARRLARALRAHPADNEGLRRWYAVRAETMSCLADALDARRGDAGAWKALHAEQDAPLLPACAILRVDLFDGAERIQAIRALPSLAEDAHDVPREWLGLLAAEADLGGPWEAASPFESAAEVLAIPNGEPLARAVPGVERRLAEGPTEGPRRITGHRMIRKGSYHVCVPMGSPPLTPGRAGASAAMFAFLAGDEAGAQALARRAAQSADPCAAEVTAVTALPGDPGPAEAMVAHARGEFLHGLLDFVVERNPEPLLGALTRTPPPDEDEKRAWALAAAGDGAGLVRWLRRPRSQPGTFLRLGAPLLRSGRDELARWVRWGRHPSAGFRPTEEVVHLGSLAAAAEALAPGDAAPLHARAARFREAILRRETAVPLAVIERL